MKSKKIISAILAAAITVAAVVPTVMNAEGENTRDPEAINVEAEKDTSVEGTTIFTVNAQRDTLMNLPYSEVNENVGRNEAGYYLGFNVYAPKDYTAEKPKYKRIYKYMDTNATKDDIINLLDSEDTGGGTFDGTSDGYKFMGCWMNVKYEFMTACITNEKKLVYALEFDWDNDNTYEQVVIVMANPTDITGDVNTFYFKNCADTHNPDETSDKCKTCGKEKIAAIELNEPEAEDVAFGNDCPNVTVGDDTNYTVEETKWTLEGQEATKFSKNGTYIANVTLEPKDGMYFASDITIPADWEKGTGNTDATITISKSFVITGGHTVTVSPAENGTVTADKEEAKEGDTVSITVTPAKGYELESITVTTDTDDESVDIGVDNTFTMPGDDVTVTAAFKKTDYTVTLTDPVNGTANVDKETANYGDKVTVTDVEADEGYELDKIEVTYTENGTEITNPITDTKTFSMPAANVTVTVTFKEVEETEPSQSEEPTPSETEEPTPSETEEPTPSETEEPTPSETEEPTPSETEEPTPSETEEPTPSVTEEPTPSVTEEPTPSVTEEPTPSVTEEPTPSVTEEPTPSVTEEPTPSVTEEPTPSVTEEPQPPVDEPEIITGSAEAEAPVDAEEGLEIKVEDLDVVLSAEPDAFDESVKSVKAEVEVNDEVAAEKENAVNEAVEAIVDSTDGEQAEINSVISITLKDQDGNIVQPVDGSVVTVTIPYDGQSNYAAYIDGDKPEFIKLDIDNGYASFDAKHFSDYYIIKLSEKAAEAVDKENSGNVPEEPPVSATTTYTGSFTVPVVSGSSSSDNTTTAPAQTEPANTDAPVSSEENAVTDPSSPSAAATNDSNNTAQNTKETNAPVPDNGNNGNGNSNTGNDGSGNNNVGNDGAGNSQDKNAATGVSLALIPALAAAAGVVVSKKKK